MNKLLTTDKNKLVILPSLVEALGLNEAILLQQVHYWLIKSKNEKDGYKWIYNSYPKWQKQFPFWSERTIWTIIHNLEEKKILVSPGGIFNKRNGDQTKWYRVDYTLLSTVCANLTDPNQLAKVARASRNNCEGALAKVAKPLPEIIQPEITTDIFPKAEKTNNIPNGKEEGKAQLVWPANTIGQPPQTISSLSPTLTPEELQELQKKHPQAVEEDLVSALNNAVDKFEEEEKTPSRKAVLARASYLFRNKPTWGNKKLRVSTEDLEKSQEPQKQPEPIFSYDWQKAQWEEIKQAHPYAIPSLLKVNPTTGNLKIEDFVFLSPDQQTKFLNKCKESEVNKT